MKYFKHIIILLLAVNANAQSAKKIQRELVDELENVEASYKFKMKKIDSLTCARVGLAFYLLDDAIPKLEVWKEKYSALLTESLLNYNRLESLKANPSEIVGLEVLNNYSIKSFEEYKANISALTAETVTYKDFVSSDNWMYPKKTEDQNEQLIFAIDMCKKYLRINQSKFDSYSPTFEKIKLYRDSLEYLYKDYKKSVAALERYNSKFITELKKLKDNQFLSKQYEKEFKAVFEDSIAFSAQIKINSIVTSSINIFEDNLIDPIYVDADFPGGMAEMMKFIRRNLKYPDQALDAEIGGKTYIRFNVNEKGEVNHIRILRGIEDCKECGIEAMKVVEIMPDWIPATANGIPTDFWFNLPISYRPN